MFTSIKPNLIQMNNNKTSEAPILIPKDSCVEGYIKSIRLECPFNGTILIKSKVIIDKASIVTGDVVCNNLMIFGHVKGNVFCTGRVTMNEITSELRLSRDILLKTIRETLYENTFAQKPILMN